MLPSNRKRMSEPLTPNAIRRLQRDLRVWERDRAELAIPSALKFADNDLSRLYINFRPGQGPYKDITLHVHATFPPDYPNSPPDVRMMTPDFVHPNVFDGWHPSSEAEGAYICLDMIRPQDNMYARPYSGWSAAYDISGLVLQLYSFLIGDDHIDQEGDFSVSRAEFAISMRLLHQHGTVRHHHQQLQQQQQAEFKCRCGFTELPALPQPPRAEAAAATPATASSEAEAPSPRVPDLPDDLVGLIISHSDTGTLTKIAEARSRGGAAGAAAGPSCSSTTAGGGGGGGGGGFSADVDDPLADIALRVKQERELVCFFHKTQAAGSGGVSGLADADAEGDVLGFGVTVARHRDGSLRSLSMAMDLLSYRAFDASGVRRSAWNVPFDAFIPLALNGRHAARAMRLLPGCVARMLGGSSTAVTEEGTLEVMARLMNSLVVEMVMPKPRAAAHFDVYADGGGATAVARHMSDAALKGFCHLHHLLLTVVLSGSSPGALPARCQRDVLAFVAGGGGSGATAVAARHKSRCPDLGLLLIKYMLVPKDAVPWSTFAPVFLRELLARHVMWVARELANGGSDGGVGGGCRAGGGRAGGGRNVTSAAAAAFLAPWRSATPELDMWRLETHLKHSLTSIMTVAVEAFFVNALARPAGGAAVAVAAAAAAAAPAAAPAASGGGGHVATVVLDQLAAIKAMYDKRNGEPPAAVFDAFSAHARSVHSIAKWSEVLVALRLGLRPPPPRPDGVPTTVGDMARLMADVLRQAVLDSRNAAYHTDPPQLLMSRAGPVGAAPSQYVDWEGSPPVGVVSDEWR